MPSNSGPSRDGPTLSPSIPSKRKSSGNGALASRRQSDAQKPGYDLKRPRETGPEKLNSFTMSKVLGKRPERVGQAIARPVFHSGHGAKKLVIKNLRTTSSAHDLEQYYQNTQRDLIDGLQAIFAQQNPRQPLESLYRGVEDICRHGNARKLYMMLREHCESYLNDRLQKSIIAHAGSSNVDMLQSLHKHWVLWNTQTTKIRSIFSYLDGSFLVNNKELPEINDMAITLFRRMAFESASPSPGGKALIGMCDLISFDRKGDPRFDATLLRESVTMLHVLNIYGKSFERMFLEKSERYFEEFAEVSSAGSLKSYISACEQLLERENHRCIAFNLDSTTKRQLMDRAHRIFIENNADKLLDSESVGKLLDENAIEPMKALYGLLRLSGLQKRLKEPWENYIKEAGSAIVNDTSRGDEMVVRLLEFRTALDTMVQDAFRRDEEFGYGLRQAFDSFINDKKILASWKTGTSKVGEMIAKYIDMLLRGGLRTLPKSLLSDVQDRVDAEKSGQATTGDEDAELDRQLDKAIELFRFIEGKDVFEAFYKQDLARRLLMGRSASADAERSMLAKLKSECGSNFTHNLEHMFKDQQLSRDEMVSYKSWCEGMGNPKSTLDLNVSVLSAASWPTYPDTELLLPDEVATQMEQFDRYYSKKYTGRRLRWKHSLAHCLVKAKFNRGTKELLVSAFQAVVLTLFNGDDGPLSYAQVSERSGLTGPDLDRTLQSLACGKYRVLKKSPKGKDINSTDTFEVNAAFTDPKVRIKINQIQMKETKEENRDTHEKVAQDRQFETQAAIVRIMKSRKSMTHANLVAEVINQTKKRGAVDPSEIKKNIEKLIEKDYLEREAGSTYTYLA
ncbi:cullin-4A [Xylariaceae sp. FL0594]|nr:cullin-4A [Xylariaceae sp. FL0594]